MPLRDKQQQPLQAVGAVSERSEGSSKGSAHEGASQRDSGFRSGGSSSSSHNVAASLAVGSTVPGTYSTDALGGVSATTLFPATQPSNSTLTPRQIFTYWDRTIEIPSFVAACIALMRDGNPGWKVTVLHEGVEGFEKPPATDAAKIDFRNNNALMADWYRLAAVYQHGGVWMDASIIPVHSAESTWLNLSFDGLTGFRCQDTTHSDTVPDCMESFVFAAPPRNPLVKAWLDELRKAITMGCAAYGGTVDAVVRGDTSLPRLCVYVAFKQAASSLPSAPSRLLTVNGCEQEAPHLCGPYHYMQGHEEFGGVTWTLEPKVKALMESLFRAGESEYTATPLIKLPSGARNYTLDNPEIWQASSFLGGLLMSALPDDPPEKLLPSYEEQSPFWWSNPWSGAIVAAPVAFCVGASLTALVYHCCIRRGSAPKEQQSVKSGE